MDERVEVREFWFWEYGARDRCAVCRALLRDGICDGQNGNAHGYVAVYHRLQERHDRLREWEGTTDRCGRRGEETVMGLSEKIDPAFASHTPSAKGLEAIDALRRGYSQLKYIIETHARTSRERSLALTELEASAMWATKAIVTGDPENRVAE